MQRARLSGKPQLRLSRRHSTNRRPRSASLFSGVVNMKCILAVLLLSSASAFADSRAWTDAQGSHHTHAELADFQNSVAYLQKDDGKIVAVPAAKLSSADRDYIRAKVHPVN